MKAKIDQIIYNGPTEYSHDYRWSIRDKDGAVIAASTSSSIEWVAADVMSTSIINGWNVDVAGLSELPPITDSGRYDVSFGFVVISGPTVPYVDDVEAFMMSQQATPEIEIRIED